MQVILTLFFWYQRSRVAAGMVKNVNVSYLAAYKISTFNLESHVQFIDAIN